MLRTVSARESLPTLVVRDLIRLVLATLISHKLNPIPFVFFAVAPEWNFCSLFFCVVYVTLVELILRTKERKRNLKLF
jgi:hypothetical protein